jgi:hypothetical protein
VPAEELVAVLTDLTGDEVVCESGEITLAPRDRRLRWAVEVAAYAHGWDAPVEDGPRVRLRPFTP